MTCNLRRQSDIPKELFFNWQEKKKFIFRQKKNSLVCHFQNGPVLRSFFFF